ncbi:hypothetical protein M885DRAFT_519301 [Pelagophyceae sp. CCMP2097]|nr:hypothetical protein M885DRAFT_519301 [Pelagophyceae sp. CCMP2097]
MLVLRRCAGPAALRRCAAPAALRPRGVCAALSSLQRRPGFAGVVGVEAPRDWETFARETISTVEVLRGALRDPSSRSRPATWTLRVLDTISNRLCLVVDAADMCRSVHTSEDWRDAADAAFEAVSEYMEELNVDVSVYGALRAAMDLEAPLPHEAQVLGLALLAEFERDGAHLDAGRRRALFQLRTRLHGLEAEYLRNVDDTVATVPRSILPKQTPVPTEYCFDETGHVSAEYVLRYVSDAPSRRAAFDAVRGASHANVGVLDALAATRHDLATTMGSQSYAHMVLEGPPKAVATLQVVNDLADRGAALAADPAKRELEAIAALLAEGPAPPLHLADVAFGRELLVEHRGLSAAAKRCVTSARAVAAISALTAQLFGVELSNVSVSEPEAWGPGVIKLEARQGDVTLGTLYLDLESRPFKSQGAAHFTVRCGCFSADARDVKDDWASADSWTTPDFQRPAVAVVCSFGDDVLTHHEFATLLHECGHALHSLLSRSTSQHLSGTRGATDIVEVPSTLFEAFAWHAPTLAQALGADEAAARRLLEDISISAMPTRGLDAQRQLALITFDQALHGNDAALNGETPTTATAIQAVERLLGPAAPQLVSLTRFVHVATAPATYYAYALDRVLARRIWDAHAANAQSSSSNYNVIRDDFLAHGAAKEPLEILRAVLGQPQLQRIDFEDAELRRALLEPSPFA